MYSGERYDQLRKKAESLLGNLAKEGKMINGDEGRWELLIRDLFEQFEGLENHLLRLNAAFEQSANAIMITDIHGNIEYVNAQFTQVTGYSPDEVLGKNPRLLKYELSKINYKELWDTISRGETWTGEFLNKSKSGNLFWELGTISPVKNQQGEIISYISIKENITQRKLMEEKLLQTRDFYLGLLEDFPVMIWQCDTQGNVNFFNKTLQEFTGWDQPGKGMEEFLQRIHPKDRMVFESALTDSLSKIQPFIVEFRLLDKYDNFRWVINHAKPFDDPEGNTSGFIASCIDIHDRILVEERLLESENKYRRMFEDASMGIFRLDRKFNFTFANKAFARIFGFDNVVDFLIELNNNPVEYFPDYLNNKGFIRQILKASKDRFVMEKPLQNARGQTIYTVIHLRRIDEPGPEGDFYIEGFIEDITQRKLAEENLLRSEQKFRALFDRSYEAIVILNDLRIADCNIKASDIFGITCDDLFGMHFRELISQEPDALQVSFELFVEKVEKALENKPQVFDLALLHRHQSFDAEISLSRVYVNNKAMVQAIIRDVSEQRFAEKQIRQARDEAERARKAQSEFLSLMSHEIRTPLNAVVSLTDLMLHEKLNADQLENLSSVKISARHLLALIDDILDYNKIESGNIQFENTDFELRKMIQELAKALEIKAREKNIRFVTAIDEKVPRVLRGDTLRLKQVLFNLLSNAIKFTQKGKVSLTISRMTDYPGDKRIRFEVEDTGIGIARDRLDAIFEKFTQAETSTSRKYGGSGLGLTICKRLIELQGGEIFAQSTQGKGSIFSFYLIMEEGELADLAPSAPEEVAEHHTLEGMKILLVEDDKMNQFVAQKIIAKKWLAALTIVSSAEESLQLIRKQDFDLILLDLLLPGISGYELTQIIRANPDNDIPNPFVPVIALTADAFQETRNKAYEAGVDDFVTKPFDYLKLLEKISRYKSS